MLLGTKWSVPASGERVPLKEPGEHSETLSSICGPFYAHTTRHSSTWLRLRCVITLKTWYVNHHPPQTSNYHERPAIVMHIISYIFYHCDLYSYTFNTRNQHLASAPHLVPIMMLPLNNAHALPSPDVGRLSSSLSCNEFDGSSPGVSGFAPKGGGAATHI